MIIGMRSREGQDRPDDVVGRGRPDCLLGERFGFLRYDRRQFSDFTLRVEYRFTPTQGANPQGNSGLGIRTGRFDLSPYVLMNRQSRFAQAT
jgi:Domain of Unknown Function (DUF1080)